MATVPVPLDEITGRGAGARADQCAFTATDQRAASQARNASDQCALARAVFGTMSPVVITTLSADAPERAQKHYQHQE